MDDEKLISLVQANEVIYNKFLPGYKHTERKKNAWVNIAKEMGLPEDICIKRWTCLRDRYTREKRQENLPSGSGSKYKYRWPLMDYMEFIGPHIVPRPVRSSVNVLEQIQSSTSNISLAASTSTSINPSSIISIAGTATTPMTLPQIISITDPQISLSPIVSITDTLTTPVTPSPEISLIDPTTTTPTLTPPDSEPDLRKKKRKKTEHSDLDEVFLEAAESFKKICQAKEEKIKQNETNPLHAFGKMILSTISTMSTQKQERAMLEITNLVMHIKLEPEN